MIFRYRVASLILLICGVSSSLQIEAQNLKDVKRLAAEFMEQEKYWDALPRLQEYVLSRPEDNDARLLWAEAQTKTCDYTGALANVLLVGESLRKPDPKVSKALAEAYHRTGQFSQAISTYKRYLAQVDVKEEGRNAAIDNIKRCAVGMRTPTVSGEVVVENMGASVNSRYDDIAPIESPNYSDRVYFSSLRNVRFVDEFGSDGKLVSIQMYRDFDMYTTHISNGAWARAESLNELLNTTANEVLYDFSDDGQVAIFMRQEETSAIFVDTFDVDDMQSTGELWSRAPEMNSAADIRGVYFFNDSVMVFSSNKHGGFGGYDLFIGLQNEQQWHIANLGEKINTSYDEIAPFLAFDGRTIYYSTNGLASMGGFDIMVSKFDDTRQDWETPSNLGRPINSPNNDVFYRLTADGTSAFYSSDRQGSKGGQDLYSCFFRERHIAQMARSVPLLFTQVRDFQLFSENIVERSRNPYQGDFLDMDKAEFSMPSLYYREGDDILTPQNMPKLNKVLGLLQTYPHVRIEIVCHSDEKPTSNFDLYFSIQRAQQVADYLESKGVSGQSLTIRGLGGTYPYVISEIDGRVNESARWFNRRIDFVVHNANQLPVRVVPELPDVSAALVDSSYDQLVDRLQGLHYRIKFASLDQMYKGDIVDNFEDAMVERSSDGKYHYYIGLFDRFSQALETLSEIKSTGIYRAEITPFDSGMQIGIGQIDSDKLVEFPDLKDYLIYLN